METIKQYTFDFEFKNITIDPAGRSITQQIPISIGVVADDGREFYAQWDHDYSASEFDDPWLQENVIAKLSGEFLQAADIRAQLWAFLTEADHTSRALLWSDQAGYDQTLWHNLLVPDTGFAIHDLKQACAGSIQFPVLYDYYAMLGKPEPRNEFLLRLPESEAHGALADARNIMASLRQLDTLAARRSRGRAGNYPVYQAWASERVAALDGLEQTLTSGIYPPNDSLPFQR